MKLKEEQIKEIAELLDCGMTCFYHLPTGKIDYHPDSEDPNFDPEPWKDITDKIKNDWDNYERFEKMDSNEGYRVMENFARSLEDSGFKNKLLEGLSKPKPFWNFKSLVDWSDYRQEWFYFKGKAYNDHVKRQIKMKK